MPDSTTNSHLKGSLVVVSPMGKENVLGRALALAELADRVVERVFVVAPDDGPLWPAAGRWPIPVIRADHPRELPAEMERGGLRWIWVVKPLSRSWKMGRALAETHPGSSLILDIDDDDEQLSRGFIDASLWNRVRVNRLRQLHPVRIKATRRKAIDLADGVTVASHAVSEQIGLNEADGIRVPHPRLIAPASRLRLPYTDGEKHVGFFGTIRSHKGVGSIERLLRADPSVVLHIFAGSGGRLLKVSSERIVEHPGDEPWETLFDSVDLVMLPQDRSKGGDVQLPAKLIDAMRFGVPVLASPTPAIREIAADAVLYVEDWSELDEVTRVLEACLQQGESLGSAARSRFENKLSLEVTAGVFRDFLDGLGCGDSPE